MKKLNSNDIAKLAGVSRSTVSRVINGYSNVPEETRKKVMKVIKENHYYPLFSGQLLTGKKTKTIGFFWVTSGNIANDALSSSYFAHVIDAASEQGYLVLSCIVPNLTEKQNMHYVRKIFMQERIDAGVFIGMNNNEPLISELIEHGKIVGLFDYYHENESFKNCITVNFDRNSGEKVIDYLHSLGHTKIGIFDGDMGRFSLVQRHEGFIRGMMKYNIPIQNKWLYFGGISKESGYAATNALLDACGEDIPTALCANNDSVAFGIYQACQERGIRIPEDISVIGIDGHQNTSFTSPPLTTIEFNFKEMFFSLISRTISTIDGEEAEENEFICGKLVARQSCKRIENI
jgi:Transcriptional regulators